MTVPSKSTIRQGRVRGRSTSFHHPTIEAVLRVFVLLTGIIVVYNGYNSYEEGEFSTTTTTHSSSSSSNDVTERITSDSNVLKSSSLTMLTSPQSSKIPTTNVAVEEPLKIDDGEIKHDDIPTATAYKQPYSKYQIVFSTGCSTFQDWQSYVFFYHVMQSGQEGHVTRIASGCTGKDLRDIHSIFDEEIKSMSPNHHLHLTPDYSKVHMKQGKKSVRPFKYFNKPFGMRHWMKYAFGCDENGCGEHDDSIVILLDPDQILLRPFTDDFTHATERFKTEDYKLKIEHGSPFAQQYGFALQWRDKVDLNHVFNGQPTNISNIPRKEALDYYIAMGPPYVATARDMWSLVSVWTDVVPRVHDNYPHLLAEMFGYNLAAAHLGLRHTIAKSFMVSDQWAGMEGWQLVTAVDKKDVCHNFPKSEYPHVIHYCQRYYIGKWFIGKYRLRKDFISCASPLLKVPPSDVALRYDYAIMPGNNERKDLKENSVKKQSFMLCQMIDALNSAAKFYKDNHCTGRDEATTANYNYTYVFFDDMSLPEDKLEILPS